MIAKVILDLKSKKINKEFDYFIPKHLEDKLKVGQRVLVSFGKMGKRLAFVVDIVSNSLYANKDIIEIIDIEPVLNEELKIIYDYISKNTVSIKSAVIQTILPVELLANYEKEVIYLGGKLPLIFKDKFVNNKWKLRQKDNIYYTRLTTLKKDGIIEINTILKPRQQTKLIKAYKYNNKHTYKRIDNYQDIIKIFFEKDKIITRKNLVEKFSVSKINTLEKNNVLLPVEIKEHRFINSIGIPIKKNIVLNNEQEKANNEIIKSLNKYTPFLLKGVTASGKTEVYLKAIEQVVKQNKTVIYLVPEINLVAPALLRLKETFKDEEIAIIHSKLSAGQKYDQLYKIYKGKAKIVLGTRSAIFAPLKNIGLIVLDEASDQSYEQTEDVYYNAIDISLLRAKYNNCPVIFGSATPTIEMMYEANIGNYKLLTLSKKAINTHPVEVNIVDLKEDIKSGNTSIISNKLDEAIKKALKTDKQIILLSNRKGYSQYVRCKKCGDVPVCPNCAISLTYYKNENKLKCNYCGKEFIFNNKCSSCGHEYLKKGIAIEQVELEARKKYPNAKIIRMDSQTTSKKGEHERLWYKFYKKEADILIGTQMVAKGFDFEDVSVVGVILADQDFNLPIYNQDEKAYILLKQTIGRCGRKEKGYAYIQTYKPNSYIIKALNHDYDYFYNQVLERRKLTNYPPFINISQIIIRGKNYLKTFKLGKLLKDELTKLNIYTLGPVSIINLKQKDLFQFKLTIKYDKKTNLENLFNLIKKFEDELEILFLPTPRIL